MRINEVIVEQVHDNPASDMGFDRSMYQRVLKAINKKIKLGDRGALSSKRAIIKKWRSGDRLVTSYEPVLLKLNISDVLK